MDRFGTKIALWTRRSAQSGKGEIYEVPVENNLAASLQKQDVVLALASLLLLLPRAVSDRGLRCSRRNTIPSSALLQRMLESVHPLNREQDSYERAEGRECVPLQTPSLSVPAYGSQASPLPLFRVTPRALTDLCNERDRNNMRQIVFVSYITLHISL